VELFSLLAALERQRRSRHLRHRISLAQLPSRRTHRGYYSNSRVDALIDQARRETDQNARKQLYYQVQEILGTNFPT